MTNPYRSQRERAAYEAGLATARAEHNTDGEEPKLLTRTQIMEMASRGEDEVNANWPAVAKAMAAGQLLRRDEDDDE